MLLNVKYFMIRLSAPLIRICNQNCTKYGMSYVKNISSSASLRNELLSEKIQSRKLVKLSGADAPSFLQGLVTNDVRIFETSTQDLLMYCMMLNTQGRILYDLLVYKVSKFFDRDSSIILECDSRASDDLLKTLSRYKLRRKAISFSKLEEYSVWSVFPNSKTSPSSSATTTSPSLVSEASDIKSDLPLRNPEKLLFHSLDPRIPNFGRRLLLPAEVKGSEVIEGCTDVVDAYENRRFDFGLSEGTEELISGQSFPLECNLFFLNGVSFSKGCYVGQELTTRTHHTGVIRKRIMPIFSRGQIPLSKVHGEGLVIVCETNNKECGKVLNWRDQKGLALLRLQETLLSPGPLLMKNPGGLVLGQVETFVPDWWPSDVDEVIKKVRSKQEKV